MCKRQFISGNPNNNILLTHEHYNKNLNKKDKLPKLPLILKKSGSLLLLISQLVNSSFPKRKVDDI